MKLIAEVPWEWALWEDDGRRVLAVEVGGVAAWTLSVELTADERALLDAQGPSGLAALIKSIQSNHPAYMGRRVADPKA